jgi:hypothetical protein
VFSSKEDLYDLLKVEGRFYLPPIHKSPVSFFRDVLMENKKFILKKDLCEVDLEVPEIFRTQRQKLLEPDKKTTRSQYILSGLQRKTAPGQNLT